MKITVEDEHRPNLPTFRITTRDGEEHARILARDVSPEFAQWIIEAAAALAEIRSRRGQCCTIGKDKARGAPPEPIDGYHEGSAAAYVATANVAMVNFGERFEGRELEVEL